MLPQARNMQMPAVQPRYRDWRNAENGVTQREYAQVVTSITDMLLEDVGEDASRWADLVERAADLSGRSALSGHRGSRSSGRHRAR